MKMCTVCQHENSAGFKFCEACGATLSVKKSGLPKTQLIDLETIKSAVSQLILLDGTIFEIKMNEGYEAAVGRADLASEWKPLVDLTPHGGERGGVSRRHAVLAVQDGGVWLKDSGSSNGTRVNGRRLAPQKAERLKAGDEIEFGRIFCRFSVARKT